MIGPCCRIDLRRHALVDSTAECILLPAPSLASIPRPRSSRYWPRSLPERHLSPGRAAAQGTHLWTQSQMEEFEKGTPAGVAIESDGHLRQGPGLPNSSPRRPPLSGQWPSTRAAHAFAGTGSPATVLRVGRSPAKSPSHSSKPKTSASRSALRSRRRRSTPQPCPAAKSTSSTRTRLPSRTSPAPRSSSTPQRRTLPPTRPNPIFRQARNRTTSGI